VNPLRAETAAQDDNRAVTPRPDRDVGKRLVGRDQAAVVGARTGPPSPDTICQRYSSPSAMRLAMRSGSSAEVNAIIEKLGTRTKAKRSGPRAGDPT
jgi:hypothetical protein